MLIDIPGDVASRLQDLAKDRGCSVGELLRNLVEPDAAEQRYGTLADMARDALSANLGAGKHTDTSARSREILKAEFPDYIRRNKPT